LKRIELTKGYFALVDDVDYEILSYWLWHVSGSKKMKRYALRNVGNRGVLMHRVIMGLQFSDKEIVDHVNGNSLDNRRSNLRICNIQENSFNKKKTHGTNSVFRGVCAMKGRVNSWVAHIGVNHQKIYLGYFNDELRAAQAYDEAAKKYHGKFAKLNFGG
jgi:hypothetical protein